MTFTPVCSLCVSLKQQARKVWRKEKIVFVLFFSRKSFLSISCHFFSFIWFDFFLSLPLIFMFIWTRNTAYMYLRDAVYYIYTYYLGDLISPMRLRWNILPLVYVQSSIQKCRQLHCWALSQQATDRVRVPGEKSVLQGQSEKAGEEAVSHFQNHMTVTSVVKKKVKYTVLKIQ